MRFRNLDSNGDFKMGKGKNDYVDNDEAIKLNIKTRILSWVGDCFFALQDGIDWTNRMSLKSQRTLLEQDLKSIISKSYGVVDITSISTDLTNRAFTALYTIKTIFSPSVNGSVTVGG